MMVFFSFRSCEHIAFFPISKKGCLSVAPESWNRRYDIFLDGGRSSRLCLGDLTKIVDWL